MLTSCLAPLQAKPSNFIILPWLNKTVSQRTSSRNDFWFAGQIKPFIRIPPVLPKVESYQSTTRLGLPPHYQPMETGRCSCRLSLWCPTQQDSSWKRARTATKKEQWPSAHNNTSTPSISIENNKNNNKYSISTQHFLSLLIPDCILLFCCFKSLLSSPSSFLKSESSS